jgi:hypothetical protein
MAVGHHSRPLGVGPLPGEEGSEGIWRPPNRIQIYSFIAVKTSTRRLELRIVLQLPCMQNEPLRVSYRRPVDVAATRVAAI